LKVSKLYKFMALPWRGKWLYLNAALWLLAVKAELYLLPFDRLRQWMARFDEPDGKPADMEEMRAIIQAIERIGQWLAPLRINCLPQALVGHRLLGRKGFDVQLKIGVFKDYHGKLAAHAWLEYEGRVILGDLGNLGQFTSFPTLEVA
jgi:Transglutaminase-like superfamily